MLLLYVMIVFGSSCVGHVTSTGRRQSSPHEEGMQECTEYYTLHLLLCVCYIVEYSGWWRWTGVAQVTVAEWQ